MRHNRLGGLLEMLLTYAKAFAVSCTEIEFRRGQINGLMMSGAYDPIAPDNPVALGTLDALEVLLGLCEGIPSLQPVAAPILRTQDRIRLGMLPLLMQNDLHHINSRIFDELNRHFYYPVTEAYAATYANSAPFGEDVYNNFPSARLDIQDAGKCIILGQGTAGVFHLMRVMEVALKVLGRDLNVPYAPSWERYIEQITTNMGVKRATKSAAWLKKEPFYKQIVGDLTAIKTAWRNPTMHIHEVFSVDRATTIYQAVVELMQRMAERGMKERGRPVAVIVALAGTP